MFLSVKPTSSTINGKPIERNPPGEIVKRTWNAWFAQMYLFKKLRLLPYQTMEKNEGLETFLHFSWSNSIPTTESIVLTTQNVVFVAASSSTSSLPSSVSITQSAIREKFAPLMYIIHCASTNQFHFVDLCYCSLLIPTSTSHAGACVPIRRLWILQVVQILEWNKIFPKKIFEPRHQKWTCT